MYAPSAQFLFCLHKCFPAAAPVPARAAPRCSVLYTLSLPPGTLGFGNWHGFAASYSTFGCLRLLSTVVRAGALWRSCRVPTGSLSSGGPAGASTGPRPRVVWLYLRVLCGFGTVLAASSSLSAEAKLGVCVSLSAEAKGVCVVSCPCTLFVFVFGASQRGPAAHFHAIRPPSLPLPTATGHFGLVGARAGPRGSLCSRFSHPTFEYGIPLHWSVRAPGFGTVVAAASFSIFGGRPQR